MKRLKQFIRKHGHFWPLLYIFIYMPWFIALENKYQTLDQVFVIHVPLDDAIPFCPAFIFPYLLWFLFIPVVFSLLYFRSGKEFYRLCAYEFTGMTIALIIYSIFPNGHDLRADIPQNGGFLYTLVSFIYNNDTSTNVCPSIHVFATIAAHLCLIKSSISKDKPYIKPVSWILTVLICSSTVLLKQHSIVDLICGVILAVVLYFVVFKWWFKNVKMSKSGDKQTGWA